jgi:hypothetical protein
MLAQLGSMFPTGQATQMAEENQQGMISRMENLFERDRFTINARQAKIREGFTNPRRHQKSTPKKAMALSVSIFRKIASHF